MFYYNQTLYHIISSHITLHKPHCLCWPQGMALKAKMLTLPQSNFVIKNNAFFQVASKKIQKSSNKYRGRIQGPRLNLVRFTGVAKNMCNSNSIATKDESQWKKSFLFERSLWCLWLCLFLWLCAYPLILQMSAVDAWMMYFDLVSDSGLDYGWVNASAKHV